MHKENSRIVWSVKQVLSLTKKLTKPVNLQPAINCLLDWTLCSRIMLSFAISFSCGKNRLATSAALLFTYKPNPNLNSGKFHTQKKSAKKYPHLKILAYCICNNKETRLQTERKKKNMLKDKFAFIDEATTTAIRNEQDELRMHGATRTLQTLCSSLPSGINAERERFRKMPMQR